MNQRSWKIFIVLTILGSLCGLIKWQFTTGFLFGVAISFLLYYRNENYWNDVLDMKEAGKGMGMSHFIINYLLMAIPLILCAKFPQYMNIFFCAFGMTLIKISLIIDSLITKK